MNIVTLLGYKCLNFWVPPTSGMGVATVHTTRSFYTSIWRHPSKLELL